MYRYYGDTIPLARVMQEVPSLEEGGTLAVLLACHALERGYRATIYSYNLNIFTPSALPFSRDAIAAECTPNVETVVIHDLDLELLRRHRAGGATQNLQDRRRDLYEVVEKR